MKPSLAIAAIGLVAALTGCKSVGPATVARDRAEYSSSIGESWKRQTLLNIVKLRYLDPPIFVDVGQIVAGYSLETALSGGGQISSAGAIQGNTATVGGSARFTDRPTITYVPLTGNKFVKSLMTPLTPESVFFTIESGWPVDAVFYTALASINGLKNQETNIKGVTPPDPNFLRVLTLLREIQISGAVGMRIRQDAQKQQTTLLTFRSQDISQETIEKSLELRRLLHLDPEATEFKVVFGATAADNKEVAVLTRSITRLMATMASQIEVPPEHLAQHRATPGWESVTAGENGIKMLEIHSSKSASPDAFVSVHYRDHWFWIDDSDLRSKRVFAFMMLLFTLADSGEKEPLPLITIPAQ
jgi:hypothetical protein